MLGVGICYAVGTGLLSLPKAFFDAGIVVSIVIVALFAYLSTISTNMITEAAAAAAALARRERASQSAQANEGTPADDAPDFSIDRDDGFYFQYSELCSRLLGRAGGALLSLSVFAYLATTLVFYAAVATTSLVSAVPVVGVSVGAVCGDDAGASDYPAACNDAYWIYLFIFLALVVVLGMGNIADTAFVQNFFSVFRWIVILLIGGCCTWSLAAGPAVLGPDQRTHAPYVAQPMNYVAGKFQGTAYLVPAIAFSFIYHHSQTLLIEPLENKRVNARRFAAGMNVSLATIYLIVGVLAALTFGSENKKLVIWSFQTWAGGSDWHNSAPPTWARVITEVMLMYPALSLVSAYPLNAYTLSEDLYSHVRKIWLHAHGRAPAVADAQTLTGLIAADETASPGFFRRTFDRYLPPDAQGVPQWLHAAVRLAVLVVPVLVAGGVRSPATVIKICGLFGFVFLLFMPPLCALVSRRNVARTFGPEAVRQNPHYSVFNGPVQAFIHIAMGTFSVVLAIMSL